MDQRHVRMDMDGDRRAERPRRRLPFRAAVLAGRLF